MKRNPLAFFCLLGTVAWLSSCSAVRQCKAPELNLPERMADVGPDTLSVADTKWWQFYGDTLLCRIIERTLSHNKDLLGAAANVERMRQLYRVSKAEQLPVFSAPVYALGRIACPRPGAGRQTDGGVGTRPVGKIALGTAAGECGISGFGRSPTSDAHVLGGRSSHGLFPADRHG